MSKPLSTRDIMLGWAYQIETYGHEAFTQAMGAVITLMMEKRLANYEDYKANYKHIFEQALDRYKARAKPTKVKLKLLKGGKR